MDKKNIAIILPKLSGGGAERVGAAVSQHLAEKNNVFLIIYDDSHIVYPHGGEVLPLHIKGTYNPFVKAINIVRRIHAIKKIKREKQIDISFSFLETTNFVNIFSHQQDKVIISVRNYTSKSLSGFYGFLYKAMIKMFYNKASKIIVVSKVAAKDLIENFGIVPDIIQVIYNPYDVERIKKLCVEPLPGNEAEIFRKPVLINVGRLHPQKGQDLLIKIFLEAKKRIHGLHLVILGESNSHKQYEKDLRQYIKNNHLSDDISFLGFKENPFKYLARSRLFVFPSRYEGFPNALCEAMACGLPVIASDCPSGPREILVKTVEFSKQLSYPFYGDYGVLGSPMSGINENQIISNFTSGILTMLTNDKLYANYRKKGLERINDVEYESIMDEYEKLIQYK